MAADLLGLAGRGSRLVDHSGGDLTAHLERLGLHARVEDVLVLPLTLV